LTSDFSTQVHDFDLGIDPWPGGLFWTVRIDDDDVDVHFGAGKASYRVQNLPVLDYFNIPNGLFHFPTMPPDPAIVSFDIEWSGPVTDRSHLLEADNQAVGDFVLSQATMTWSAKTPAVKFVSDPNGTSSIFAQLGRMRNGRFFGGG
jgi:hypothetical protein